MTWTSGFHTNHAVELKPQMTRGNKSTGENAESITVIFFRQAIQNIVFINLEHSFLHNVLNMLISRYFRASLEMELRDWLGLLSGCRRSLVRASSAAFNMAVRASIVMDVNVCCCACLFGYVLFSAVCSLPGNKN
jgi:hypothetical protein